jgi:hypothetical protein
MATQETSPIARAATSSIPTILSKTLMPASLLRPQDRAQHNAATSTGGGGGGDAIPEPASLALLGVGAIGLAVFR